MLAQETKRSLKCSKKYYLFILTSQYLHGTVFAYYDAVGRHISCTQFGIAVWQQCENRSFGPIRC